MVMMHVFPKSFRNRRTDICYEKMIKIRNTEISKEFGKIKKSDSFQGMPGIFYSLYSTFHNILTCLQIDHLGTEK